MQLQDATYDDITLDAPVTGPRSEYPRHVHRVGGVWKQVENATEFAAALDDGWFRLPTDAEKAARATEVADAPEDAPGAPIWAPGDTLAIPAMRKRQKAEKG